MKISPEHQAAVKAVLERGIRGEWSPELVGETQRKVMDILYEPYFKDLEYHVEPVIVEDTLVADSVAREKPAEARYALRLKNHPAVQKAFAGECNGVLQMVEDTYTWETEPPKVHERK